MSASSISAQTVALLEAALAAFSCEKRSMFGCQVYFTEGAIFAGVQRERIFLRLSAADRESFFSAYPDAVLFEPIPGRVVREYVVVPTAVLEDRALLESWLERAYRYAAALHATTRPADGEGRGE